MPFLEFLGKAARHGKRVCILELKLREFLAAKFWKLLFFIFAFHLHLEFHIFII